MERFTYGGQEFDEQENVELLLEIARCPGDREDIAAQLLIDFGSLKNILEAREEALRNTKGIGEKTATVIRTILYFLRIWERASMEERQRIQNTAEAFRFCKSLLLGERNEKLYAICLDTRCRVLGKRLISEGSLREVNAYPRNVLETALNYNANSVLLCHNHPGGNDRASSEDIRSTLLIQKLLKSVDVALLDHIIVAGSYAYSMMEHGDISRM